MSKPERLIPLALAVAAVAIRLPHLDWGLPLVEEEAYPLKKALTMWGWESGRVQLDPQTAGWPALSFYLHLLLQHLHLLGGKLTGAFTDRYDYYVSYLLDPSTAVLLARALGVAAAAGTVYVASRLARRLAGPPAAWMAGGLLVLCPMLVRHAQLVTPDILLTFCAAIATAHIVAAHAGGRTRDYLLAGLWIGLGAACKYTPVLLLPSLWLAHWLRVRDLRVGNGSGSFLRDRRPWLATLVAAAAFLATSPFTIFDLATLQRDVSHQITHMGLGHFGQRERAVGYLYYVTDVLRPGLGWPALLLGTSGLLAAAWRRRGSWLVLALCLLPFYLVMGGLRTTFDRYMLPALLPLALGLAGGWTVLRPRWNERPRWLRIMTALLLVVGVLAPPAGATWRYHREQGRTSTRLQADRFLREQMADEPAYLALELYTVELPADDFVQRASSAPVLERLSDEQRTHLLDRSFYPYVFLPMYSIFPERSAVYYDLRLYRPYEYFVTSSMVRGRYEANAGRFGRHLEFYADLERYGELMRVFAPNDRTRGPELRIYRMTAAGWDSLRADRGPLPANFAAAHREEISPDQFHPLLENIGRHAFDQGLFAEAELCYDLLHAELAEVERDQVAWRLGLLKIQSRRWASAEVLFRRWLARHPDDAGALANLGWVQQAQGNLAAAREYYDRAIAASPRDPAAVWARDKLREMEADDQ